MPTSIKIIPLAAVPECIPILAGWFNNDWPVSSASADDSRHTDYEPAFRSCARMDALPLTLVALNGEEPVGTVFLLDRASRPEIAGGPWIEGLFVAAKWRHRGVALALVDAAVSVAGSLGTSRLFMGIRASPKIYEARGWLVERSVPHPDASVTVLSKNTAPAT